MMLFVNFQLISIMRSLEEGYWPEQSFLAAIFDKRLA